MADLHFFSIGNNINNTGHYGFVKIEKFDDSKIAYNLMVQGDTINKMGTSIPTPYARLYLFDSAFKQINSFYNDKDDDIKKVSHEGYCDNEGNIVPTAYHALASECLDMLEFLYKYGDRKELEVLEWDVDAECKSLIENDDEAQHEFGEAMRDACKYTVLGNFSKIYLFVWNTENGDSIVIGGTSPITLVYTSPNVRRELKEEGIDFYGGAGNLLFDNSRPFALHQRSEDFRMFMYTYWNTDLSKADILKKTYLYSYIKDSQAFFDKKIRINNPTLKGVATIKAKGIGTIKTAGVNLYCSSNIFPVDSCDYRIKPTVDFWKVENVAGQDRNVDIPLALTTCGVDGYEYANRPWNRATDIIPPSPNKNLTERVLPGTTFTYPYLSVDDFLEPKIIEVSYKVRKDAFYTGSSQYLTYILPLKKNFFKFFRIEDIDNMLDIVVDNDTLDVTVRVSIPLLGDKEITFEKVYRDGDEEGNNCDKVRCFDKEMFDLAIFPSYRLPNNNAYNIMLGTQKIDDLQLKFYRIADLPNNADINDVTDDVRTVDKDFKTRHLHISGDFDFIEIAVPEKGIEYHALIIPRFKQCPDQTKDFSFCVDFGTTNTHVAYASKTIGSNSDITLAQVKTFEILDNDKQLLTLHDEGGPGYFMKFPTALNREFVPSKIQKDTIHYPMRTSTLEKITAAGNMKCFSSTNIGFYYDNELIKDSSSQGRYRTNIKWAKNDPLAQTRLEEYFKELLWLMKGKTALNEGGCNFKVVATYPLSMSVPEVQIFKNAWKTAARWLALSENSIKFELESVAPYYTLQTGDKHKYGEPYMNLDIGGGTTDILHVRPLAGGKDESSVFSALFAANDLWGDGVDVASDKLENGFIDFYKQSEAYKILSEIKKAEIESVLNKEDLSSADFISYLFTHDNDINDPFRFSQAIASSTEMMRIVITHFASLIYYVAIILDTAELKIPRLINFTGMGSKYIKLISDDDATLGLLISKIFSYYGKLVGNDELIGIKVAVNFEKEPKLVTAQGGLIMDSRSAKNHLIPDNCFCHGYKDEEYGTTITYGEMGNMKNAILDSFGDFCNMFSDSDFVSTLAKLGYNISTDFTNHLKDFASSSFNVVLDNNSNNNFTNYSIGDPMFFWPLKETLYQMTKVCACEVRKKKEKEE